MSYRTKYTHKTDAELFEIINSEVEEPTSLADADFDFWLDHLFEIFKKKYPEENVSGIVSILEARERKGHVLTQLEQDYYDYAIFYELATTVGNEYQWAKSEAINALSNFEKVIDDRFVERHPAHEIVHHTLRYLIELFERDEVKARSEIKMYLPELHDILLFQLEVGRPLKMANQKLNTEKAFAEISSYNKVIYSAFHDKEKRKEQILSTHTQSGRQLIEYLDREVS